MTILTRRDLAVVLPFQADSRNSKASHAQPNQVHLPRLILLLLVHVARIQRRRPFDVLAFQVEQAGLLVIGAAAVDEVLNHVQIAVLAAHDEAGDTVELDQHDSPSFVLGAIALILFELLGFACLGQLEDQVVRVHVVGETRVGAWLKLEIKKETLES